MSEIIEPPWSSVQVEALNAYQDRAPMHPFTCANRGAGHLRWPNERDVGLLTATPDGWTCRDCDYRQFWAHGFMADTSWWMQPDGQPRFPFS